MMENIHITAHLSTPIAIDRWLPMDSLLMALEAQRLRLPPIEIGGVTEIPIEAQRHDKGFYCASWGRGASVSGSADQMRRRRRFGVREGFLLGDETVKKVPLNVGPLKAIDLPAYTKIIPKIEWWIVGDLSWVKERLSHCLGLGKLRGHGYGEVDRWDVEPCVEDWSIFYPCDVAGEIRPARALPADMNGVRGMVANMQYCRVLPPYWDTSDHVLCAVPEDVGT